MLRQVARKALQCSAGLRPAAAELFDHLPKSMAAAYSVTVDRDAQAIKLSAGVWPVAQPTFFSEVADEKSIEDAPIYANNTENYIGTVKVPVGACGPLQISGDYATGRDYLLPMATTEGALVASYNRGAKAIRMSGGCTARILGRQMVRAPVFMFSRISEATDFIHWAQKPEIMAEVMNVINGAGAHIHAVNVHLRQVDRKVHLFVGIDSENAAGQNMVTYAGQAALEYLNSKYPGKIEGAFIEGGFNSGKRGSVMHLLQGKGHYVVVDAMLPRDIIEKTFHVTPRELAEFQQMHAQSATMLHTLSATAHAANGLAALFIACGQDPACVAESQAGVTRFEARAADGGPGNDMLWASTTLTSLIVSTVGGGTGLPSQRANLDLVGVKSANELAEVAAALTLAGELSFYAAMAADEFSAAHFNMTHKD